MESVQDYYSSSSSQQDNFINKFHELFNASVKLRKYELFPLNNNNNHNNYHHHASIKNEYSVVTEGSADSINVIYNPNDDANYWMYTMIVIGCAFVVFVIGSIYLLCTNAQENNYHDEKARRPGGGGSGIAAKRLVQQQQQQRRNNNAGTTLGGHHQPPPPSQQQVSSVYVPTGKKNTNTNNIII